MKEKSQPKQSQGVIQMTTKVQKWGNSLAVRIPVGIAEAISIDQGSEVEIIVENQMIILKPKKSIPSLEDLLSKINPENRHEEVDFGELEGNEIL